MVFGKKKIGMKQSHTKKTDRQMPKKETGKKIREEKTMVKLLKDVLINSHKNLIDFNPFEILFE